MTISETVQAIHAEGLDDIHESELQSQSDGTTYSGETKVKGNFEISQIYRNHFVLNFYRNSTFCCKIIIRYVPLGIYKE